MNLSSKIDRVIGTYISEYRQNDFDNILSKDERLEAASYLSELPNGLLGWYPFQADSTILQIGSLFGAFTEMLSSRCKRITVVENDSYRARMTKIRLEKLDNLEVVNKSIFEYGRECRSRFDYVIFVVDENIDVIPDKETYFEIIQVIRSILHAEGKLLMALPNRFGAKYFCGEPDPNTKLRFDGMTDNESGLYRFSRTDLLEFINSSGFCYSKIYYPMPDHWRTRLIYTENYRPGVDMREKLDIYVDYKAERILDEPILVDHLLKNDEMPFFSNSFLIEAGNTPCSNVVYSAISAERGRDKSFATNLYDNDIVKKIPLYPEGKAGIERLLNHTKELSDRGIPVLEMEEKNGAAIMTRIYKPSLSQYIRDEIKKDADVLIRLMDKLYEYILKSSEHISGEKNYMRHWAPEAEWGVILKKAYIEMIPVNCFCDQGELLFYDQEFVKEDCPANYVLFRGLRDMYAFASEIEESVPLETLKSRYGLASTWKFYEQEEEMFQTELRRRNIYSGFYHWIRHYGNVMKENRRKIDMQNQEYHCFDPLYNLDGRRIVLFGSGKIADYYLSKYGREYMPIFIVDNDSDKWGSRKDGIEIKPPNALHKMLYGTYRVIIAIKDYEPIVKQLEEMGIKEDSYRILSWEIDTLIAGKLSNTMSDGKYNIGYVTGVFDLFHIGHLNLLKNCRKRCHYLVAGVLTDELTEQDKAKKPFIPFEERVEIVKQCKYVDRVVPVDFHNTNKIDAWKELKYGCLFSGSDHEGQPYWSWLQKKLRTLGSELEFFPYTQSTSSTMLQSAIMNELE